MNISDGLQILGLALLTAFADTFGLRWGFLAAGLGLIVLGFAYSEVTVTLPKRPRRVRRAEKQSQGEPPYGIVVGSPDY